MKRNNKGFSSGLMLVVILLVIVIVALLFTAQMGAFGMGKTGDGPAQTPDPVEQAQEAVDAVNDHLQQQYGSMEEP